MITPIQSRMARAALGWNVHDLGRAARVAGATVNRFEMGRAAPIPATLAAIQRAFEAADVIFIENGVIFIPPESPKINKPPAEAQQQVNEVPETEAPDAQAAQAEAASGDDASEANRSDAKC
jgi:transcriptional regulator with XRE-family HTH domain